MNNILKVSLENIIPLTEARDHFSQIVAEVQKDKLYVLTKAGKPAVAIVDVKYLEHITGGNVNSSHVEREIQKAPEKVGRPQMVEHSAPKPIPPTLPNVSQQPSAPPPPSVAPNKPSYDSSASSPPGPPPTNMPPANTREPAQNQNLNQPKSGDAGLGAPASNPAIEQTNHVKSDSNPTQKTSYGLISEEMKKPQAPAASSETTKTDSNSEATIDVQFDGAPMDNKPVDSKSDTAPDDKASPAQYSGESDEGTSNKEPTDMAID